MNHIYRYRHLIILLLVMLVIAGSTVVAGARLPLPEPQQSSNLDSPAYPSKGETISYTARNIDITHDGMGSTVQVSDQFTSPTSGPSTFYISGEVTNFAVMADDQPLSFTAARELLGPDTKIEVNVPEKTSTLIIAYDRLDGALSHDNTWHYYGTNLVWDLLFSYQWGPITVTMNLPDDAEIDRYSDDGYTTVLDSHTIRFQPPVGKPIHPWAIYRTAEIPVTYETTITPRFQVDIPQAYAPYREFLFSMLENAYTLVSEYTRQSVNEVKGQSLYDYSFSPWPLCYAGGLTVRGGPSSVGSQYVSLASVPASLPNNPLIGLTFHEFGNGWWLLFYPDYNTDPTLPWWISSEGHSGFLRSQVTLDLGYCAQAQGEHTAHYQDYLACKAQVPYTPPCYGIVETMLISLQAKYGWAPFQAIYAGVQDGSLNLSGLSDAEKDSAMIRFLSLQVGENLVPFYKEHGIYASQAVKNELKTLPTAVVPILDKLTCRPKMIHAAPEALTFSKSETQTLYIASPENWTYSINPAASWLTVTRNGSYPSAMLAVTTDLSTVPPGQYTAEIVIKSGPSFANSPLAIPVTLEKTKQDGDLFLSANRGGSAGGVNYNRSDILVVDENDNWQIVFDASDFGITADLHAFSFLADTSLLLVFDQEFDLPGAGTITPWDTVRFQPTEPGNYSQGTFALYFDGSDVGLDTNGEKIDALHAQDGNLYLSTTGNFNVPQNNTTASGSDEDILAFFPETLVGEDINALTGELYQNHNIEVSITDSFFIEGASGSEGDILHLDCRDQSGCKSEITWHGPDHDFTAGIDALHIFPNDSLANLTVCKYAVPATNVPFTFESGFGQFSLSDPADPCQTFENLPYGPYQISEMVPSSWYLSAIYCGKGIGFVTSKRSESGIEVDLPPGFTTTCTFYNELDPYESNNTMETAAPISFGDTLSAVLMHNYEDAYDYFTFSGIAGNVVTVDVASDLDFGDIQPVVRLLTADGQEISGNKSGEWYHVNIEYELPSDGRYYLEISTYFCYQDWNCTGPYTLILTRQNNPPEAAADNFTVYAGSTLEVAAPGVLGNDSDPDGNTLTAIMSTDALYGSLDLKSDGSFTYTPNKGYLGIDTFSYWADDGTEKSTVVDVTILVNPQVIFLPFTLSG